MSEPRQDTRPPRGALIVIAVGLLACVAAALLATDKTSGEAASLDWVQEAPIPDSKPVAVPGGSQSMQLIDGAISATGTNFSGYSLFRAAATLRIDGGAPVGGGQVVCSAKVGKRTEISRTAGGLRATYPRSSEAGIYSQEVPETVLIDFSARGVELAVLETEPIPGFTTEKGVKLSWPKYTTGTERLKYTIAGKPKRDLELPFYTIWKTTTVPAVAVACTLKVSAGTATVQTRGALPKASPPIDEEAEEEAEEQADEEAEEAEEKAE